MTDYRVGPIAAKGAAFDDFRLTELLSPEDAPAVIERDRHFMAARPGFNRKLLPLRIDPDDGSVFSGGRYLLDSYEHAVAFSDWVAHEFELDGVLILDRPDFAEVTTSVWHVAGAHDFKDVREAQKLYRTEVWRLESPSAADRVANDWPRVRDEAESAGRAALWLLYDGESRVATVTISDRLSPPSEGLDFASLRALETAGSLGAGWESNGLVEEKIFDRTHWVFTVWFPTCSGGPFPDPVWPNSPPLPAPEPAAVSAAT